MMDTSSVLKSSRSSGLRIREASCLDIPLIFELMLEGGLTGSFTDMPLFGIGHFKLFIWIVGALMRRSRWEREQQKSSQMSVISVDQQEIGFIQLEYGVSSTNTPQVTINLIAIAKKHQNQQWATQTIATVIENTPDDVVLVAYCTKYARAMQHVLKKLQFKRDKVMVDKLARFSYDKTWSGISVPHFQHCSKPPSTVSPQTQTQRR